MSQRAAFFTECDQFLPQTISTPEQKLWSYVLVDAIQRATEDADEDIWWLFDDPETDVGSFVWVCSSLEMDPEAVRSFLKKHWSSIKLYDVPFSRYCLR